MQYLANFKLLLNSSSNSSPFFNRTYTLKEKLLKEKQFEIFITALKTENQSETLDIKRESNNIFSKMRYFFKYGLNYPDNQLDIIFSEEMTRTTCQFIHKARHFDRHLSLDSIFQGCRNVWIMNGLQFLFDQKVELTPSIFAYSLLYPYTDNYVDDPTIPLSNKTLFASRFSDRIKGLKITPDDSYENQIFKLIGLIEKEWPRSLYPSVFESLKAIHQAQSDSAKLISTSETLSEQQVLDICIEKGGRSVIADGQLILGKLSGQQEEFLFYYGAYLQLLDDLQDIQEDNNSGLNTWFTLLAKNGVIDSSANQLFWLGKKIIDMVKGFSLEKNAFAEVMNKSIEMFILESTISNNFYFSEEQVKLLEPFCPFRYSYIKKSKKALSSYQGFIFEKIDDYVNHFSRSKMV